jgi:hypothetical protein
MSREVPLRLAKRDRATIRSRDEIIGLFPIAAVDVLVVHKGNKMERAYRPMVISAAIGDAESPWLRCCKLLPFS